MRIWPSLFLPWFNPERPPPAPRVTAQPGSVARMQVERMRHTVTKIQGKDQRCTHDPQVLSPVPWPRAMGATTGGFRAGDTAHLERDNVMSPWWEGADGA